MTIAWTSIMPRSAPVSLRNVQLSGPKPVFTRDRRRGSSTTTTRTGPLSEGPTAFERVVGGRAGGKKILLIP